MGDYLDYVDLGTGVTCSGTAVPSGYGGAHSLFLTDDLDVISWGNNDYGQLGNNNETGNAVGDESGEMGDNLVSIQFDRDPTALPTTVPTTEPTQSPTTIGGAPQFSLNQYQTCMAYEDEVKCWGQNSVCDPSYNGGAVSYIYQPPINGFDLGDADGTFNVSYVRCGKEHTCAISDEGRARCWGMSPCAGLLFTEHCFLFSLFS